MNTRGWLALAAFTWLVGTAAASELTNSDLDYLYNLTKSTSFNDYSPSELRCLHELINRPGSEEERDRRLSYYITQLAASDLTNGSAVSGPTNCPK